MPGVITRKLPWLIQPQYPVAIDWSNPDTAGLLLAVNGATPTLNSSGGAGFIPSADLARVIGSTGVGFTGSLTGTALFANQNRTWMVLANAVPQAVSSILIAEGNPAFPGQSQTFGLNDVGGGGRSGAGRYSVVNDNGSGVGASESNVYTIAGTHWYEADYASPVAPRIVNCYRNGDLIFTGDLGIYGSNASPNLTIGGGPHTTYLILGWNRILSSAERARIRANPWQIFQPISRKIWVASAGGGGAAALAGNAAAQAVAAAALSVSVPLAGAGITVASASGALSVSIPLSAAATATANATGGLSLSIPLSGSAVAQALASAGITQAVPLAGSAAALASAAGALSLNISLSGAAIAQAAAAADLTATSGSSLSGNAQAAAAASGALSLNVPLSGASLAVSSAAGTLTQIVPLSGSAAAASLATGGLDVSVKLSGAALAVALASAGLTVGQSGLSGAAAGNASASGTVTLRVNLDGAALVQAIAAAAVSAVFLARYASLVPGNQSAVLTRINQSAVLTRINQSAVLTRYGTLP